MIKLDVKFDKPLKPFGQLTVQKVLKAAENQLNLEKKGTLNVGVKVTDSDKVQDLNRKYGGQDEATDVLSFNYAEGTASPIATKAGDIVISHEHVLRQAKATATTPENELALLILHGLMHILNFDHNDVISRQKFDTLQKTIIQSAGLTYRDFSWKS